MAYSPIPTSRDDIKTFLSDIISRKEFSSYVQKTQQKQLTDEYAGFDTVSKGLDIMLPGLQLHGAQLFQRAFSGPHTPYPRMLLNWQTGAGKSIAAVSLAQEYVKIFRQGGIPADTSGNISSYAGKDVPSVVVIGFTVRATILAEMMSHPEFGYVSDTEVAELSALSREVSTNPTEEAIKKFGTVRGQIKRKITDRSRGGLFKFYGYKEFANKLFAITQYGEKIHFKVQSLYEKTSREFGGDISAFHEKVDDAVRNGFIKIDRTLINELRGGFMICDEIHNVYNIMRKNNYGIAIQYALDILGESAPRTLYMSATPMKGSAKEFIDILNLLVPKSQLPGGRHFVRSDFFEESARHSDSYDKKGREVELEEDKSRDDREDKSRDDDREDKSRDDDGDLADGDDDRDDRDDDGDLDEDDEFQETFQVSKLLPGALEKISMVMLGRVSFLFDTDSSAYPQRIFMGESFPDIPYLKITLCPMSKFHKDTIVHEFGKINIRSLQADSYSLCDIAFPNPASDEFGIFKSGGFVQTLSSAPAEWREQVGLEMKSGKYLGTLSGTQGPSGMFLHRKNIGKYSGKYEKLLELILSIMRGDTGKIMVYHHRVRMSGVLLLQEMMRVNGIIGEDDMPTDNTLCAICGYTHASDDSDDSWEKNKHLVAKSNPKFQDPKFQDHKFEPCRFVSIHSDADKTQIERSIVRYNSRDNLHGNRYRIMIGSRIIKESYNFKAVKFQIICSLPMDIPTLIQIFGRIVRRNSHSDLSPDERTAKIWILVSHAIDEKTRENFLEYSRYVDKLMEFGVIQEVERSMRSTAVDMYANYSKILAAYPNIENIPTLESLPLKPIFTEKDIGDVSDLKKDTFYAYGHSQEEVSIVKSIVSALFRIRSVWKYEDLWAAIKNKQVKSIAYNPDAIMEPNFALALFELTEYNPVIRRKGRSAENTGMLSVVFVDPYYIRYEHDSEEGFDYESYMRRNNCEELADMGLKLSEYLRMIQSETKIDAALSKITELYDPIDLCLIDEKVSFHESVMIAEITKSVEIPIDMLEMYHDYGLIIFGEDVKDVQLIRDGSRHRGPIGYVRQDSIRIYDRDSSEWYLLPRNSIEFIAKMSRRQENDMIVGFIEGLFKIRPPIHKIITDGSKKDIRTLNRGAVCVTRNKDLLKSYVENFDKILKKIDTAADYSKQLGYRSKSHKVLDICRDIKMRMLILEKHSRINDGKHRWLYLYNEIPPAIR